MDSARIQDGSTHSRRQTPRHGTMASSASRSQVETGGLPVEESRDLLLGSDDEDLGGHIEERDGQLLLDASEDVRTAVPDTAAAAAAADSTHRTTRTPNRVRFDLTPTVVQEEGNGWGRLASHGKQNGHGSNGNGITTTTTNGHTRLAQHQSDYPNDARYDNDDDDTSSLLSDLDFNTTRNSSEIHRRPLLSEMEAPSVRLANSSWASNPNEPDEDHDASLPLDALHGGGGGTLPHIEHHTRPKSSLSSAFMNMANSIIGAGIIGQPYALRQAGLLSGIFLLISLTIIVDWTIRLIVINSKLSGANSFQGTVEKCFGRPGLVAISLAQWCFAFGGMVAFGVIVGDSIPHVLGAVWPGLGRVPVLGALVDRRVVIVVFTLGVSFPLTLYRDIAKLAKASTLALISMVVILVTVLIQGVLTPSAARGSFSVPLLTVNSGIFQAIGVISFAFVCHHNSLLIYGSLRTPTIDRFSRVTHFSTFVSMLACLLMALAGFLTFGDKTLGNVLNNFSPDNTMANIARLCFGLNMLTTLPLEAFVCREVMMHYFYPEENNPAAAAAAAAGGDADDGDPLSQPFNLKLHVGISTGLVVAAMGLSLVTCDLGIVFELVGATSACAMAYILPPLCFLKLTKERGWKTTLVAWAVVVFGCVVMGISTVLAVGKLVYGTGEAVQCV